MKLRRLVALLAFVCSFVFATAMAQPLPPPAQASAPTVTLTTDQFLALVAQKSMGTAPVAAPAPVVAVPGTTTTTTTATISADGVLGFSWTQIFGGLGGVLSMALGAFAIFKTAGWLKARRIVEIAAEGAYHVAERLGTEMGLSGAQKTALAIAAFYSAMTGHGITTISQSQVESAKVTWTAMAAQNPTPVPPAPAPAAVAKTAAELEAARLANAGATATDLNTKAAS